MIKAAALVFTALVLSGALLRGWSYALRRGARRRIEGEALLLEATGVSLRVQVHGSSVLPGMRHGANRTKGDLLLTDKRFVVASNRGALLDLKPGASLALTAARAPGPGRLILEGTVARPDRPPGMFRIELMVDGERAWARALEPYVATPD